MRVVYDFDLALSGHQTLVNSDLLLTSEHEAFVSRQATHRQVVCLSTQSLTRYRNVCGLFLLVLRPVNKNLLANELVFAFDMNLAGGPSEMNSALHCETEQNPSFSCCCVRMLNMQMEDYLP